MPTHTHTCDAQDLLDASKCFSCLNPHQLQVIMVALMCRQLSETMPSCDPSELLAASKCFECLTPHQLMVIQTQLLCEWINGGTGADGCILCGDDNPVDAPDCDCAIYYRRDNKWVWLWDSSAWTLIYGGP